MLLEDFEELHLDQHSQNINKIVGIPRYIASGSHYFENSRYRFLIMPRYKTDLHSILKNGRLNQKHFLIVASQIIDVLMHLHNKHYVHSDIKAENIMIGLCKMPDKGLKQSLIKFSGTKISRRGRVQDLNRSHTFHTVQNDMYQLHNLRPTRSVTYAIDENSRSTNTPESDDSEQDEDFELSPRKGKSRRATNKKKAKKNVNKQMIPVKQSSAKSLFNKPILPQFDEDDNDDRVYVIDYGLATKFIDTNGEHKPFCMDQRRAHDGTLEFTSRDAHFGAHSRRSDLECLGYNLIYWSQGFLPWKDDKLKEQPEIVHRLKEVFMTDVKEIMKLLYGKEVPRYLIEFMHYVGHLEFDAEPNYDYLKGLFHKEFIKLGFKKSEMKFNLNEILEESTANVKSLTENEMMMSTIIDMKSVKKLGFLIATDNFDGTEPLTKPNESISLNVTSKASPKNLRSKEKTKGKRSKRQPKVTGKELISGKMAQGKKLSIAEIATLDPDQIARDRADREYEKFDEKIYYQTPQRYKGNPTYAILEIENKLKNNIKGSSALMFNGDIELIKGYTKPMMDVLNKKQQMMVEQQIGPIEFFKQKRSIDGLRDVMKLTKKNMNLTNDAMVNTIIKRRRQTRRKPTKSPVAAKDIDIEVVQREENTPELPRRKCGRRKVARSPSVIQKTIPQSESMEPINDVKVPENSVPVKRKRGRPKIIRNIVEPPETEEDSVYYDIPGEGSDDGVKEISDNENEPEIIPYKKSRRVTPSEENSNQGSNASANNAPDKKQRGRYYADHDYNDSTDESSNISSITVATKSTDSFKPRGNRQGNIQENGIGIATRNKVKSRSTSRSAAAFNEVNDQSECSEQFDNDSEYQIQSEDDTEEELEEQEPGIEYDQSDTEENENSGSEIEDESNDSIDFKYSPIKTRHNRKRINFNLKQIRGKYEYSNLLRLP